MQNKTTQNILNLSINEVDKFIHLNKYPSFRTKQILDWIYNKNILDFNKMSNLSKDLKQTLSENFTLQKLNIEKIQESTDDTSKYLFKLQDNNFIETVLIPTEKRNTICLSTQVGCRFKCLFCASSKAGFIRNLSQAEILNQILTIKNNKNLKKITNIVFMGIGEPLDNFENVIKSIKIINDKQGLNIGARKITISTCGIIPGIKKLANINLQIELAVSLHSPFDNTRNKLMPVNKKYNVSKLIEYCKNYNKKTNRQITFEYALLKDINDKRKDAEKLGDILKGFCSKVNIINYNTIPSKKFLPSEQNSIDKFISILKKKKIPVTLRKSRGQDIEGACGQLRSSST